MGVRTRGRTKALVLLIVVLAVAGGIVVYAARSRDDGSPSAEEVARRQPSCDRLRSFSALLEDVTSSAPTASAQAASDALAKMGSEVDGLVESTPSTVRNDVRTLVGALRAAPADPASTRSPQFGQAQARLSGYLAQPESGCNQGTESGDG